MKKIQKLNLENKIRSAVSKHWLLASVLLFSISYLLFSAPLTQAASFYFSETKINAGVGDSFQIDVLMDSPENVNAVEGKITFPNNLLELSIINDGNSIISLWIQRPELIDGQIIFSGAIPGGFPSNGGKLFSAEFKIKKAGTGSVSIDKLTALLNDGEGSSAISLTKSVALTLSQTATGISAPKIDDEDPPENFLPTIAFDQNIFEGQQFVSFTTQDKGSGIAYYEAAEQKSLIFQPKPANWKKTTSPYLLNDQTRKSWVGIKAVDNNGNQREVWIIPQKAIFYRYLLTIIGGIIAVIVVVLVLRDKWQRKT